VWLTLALYLTMHKHDNIIYGTSKRKGENELDEWGNRLRNNPVQRTGVKWNESVTETTSDR
jgi:hypothetical protein